MGGRRAGPAREGSRRSLEGPALSVDISRKPCWRPKTKTAQARRPGPGILLRHQPPPGLTTPRSHARTFILRPRAPFPTLFSPTDEPLSPRGAFWESRSSPPPLPPSPEGTQEEAATGEKTPESPPERSQLHSSRRQRGPPTCSPVPLPRSPCEYDIPPREGRLEWGRGRGGGGSREASPCPPSPTFWRSLGFRPLVVAVVPAWWWEVQDPCSGYRWRVEDIFSLQMSTSPHL